MGEPRFAWDIGALAHRAAHDLRGPLQRIKAFADLVGDDEDSTLDPDDRRCLEFISSSAREASALVDRLLALTLAAHRPLERRVVDVDAVAREALDGLAADVTRTGAAIALGELGTVDADPALLGTLCTELLANAFAFREADHPPRVTLRMERPGEAGTPCLRVIDDGPGVPPARRTAVLEPFVQGPDADDAYGTGLGLALCSVICERHGWTLELRDAEGGTEVRILMR